LLSDDLYFRQCATNACGVQVGLWLQAALNVGRRRGILDRSGYAEAIVGLAFCRHSHLSLDELTLCDVLRADDTTGLQKFTAVADFIGTITAEIISHVSVASKVLRLVWSLELPDLTKEAASGILLEKLLRCRSSDWKEIVGVLRQEVASQYRARDYLERWLRGHFLVT
jgi:hypothetical protein